MSELHQYVSVIGSFQGCLLFLLLISDSRVSGASKILGLMCLLIAFVFLLPFMTYGTEQNQFSWLAGWIFYLPVSYGPLVYLYCRNSILNKPLAVSDLVHALPMLSFYLFNLDTLIFSSEAFRAWITGSANVNWRVYLSEYLMFAVAFVYTVMTISLLKRYQMQAKNTLSNFNPTVFKWLWTLVIAILTIWIAKAIMSFTSGFSYLYVVVVFSDVLLVMFIYLIALAQWRNPNLFTIEHLSKESSSPDNHDSNSKPESSGLLAPDTRANLFEAVKQQVEQHSLYRDSDLTLSRLAQETGLGVHHLSEVLNQHEGKNFYQFINTYRVDDVCKRLQEDPSLKVLDIALDAGFSSKSTFNSIFKKITGTTPTQYRKQLGAV